MPPMMDKLQLSPSQQQAWQQIMQQTHQQMEQLHTQARSKILGALTPAHRELLAQIVGSLAIAPNPDPDAAVRQLNAALSPGEAQAVLSAHSAVEQQMRAIMESTHQRFQSVLTAQQRVQMPGPEVKAGVIGERSGEAGEMHGGMGQLTAGAVLLHLASGEGEDHFFMMMHTEHRL